jgi:UDP-N-acetylglucosamine 1-carboxyvinyltransferase
MGAQIDGEGTSEITIQGVDRLGGATHPVVTDRIELGTYMLAPAICGRRGGAAWADGSTCWRPFAKSSTPPAFRSTETKRGLKVGARIGRALRAVDVVTAPFPAFPPTCRRR